MGKWIRSQDGIVLANIVSFFIDEKCSVCGYDNSTNDADCYFYLGHYSTKEKAIKVLDMIQEHIECEYDIGVFQMPLDEEAEV